jgi:hypothetical protein
MTQANGDLQIQWLVACLSAWDIAPHPNFRTDTATGSELLALLMRFQWREYETYKKRASEATLTPEDTMFLDSVSASLDSDTTSDGLEQLQELAHDERLPFGKRAAAGLLAAVASSELDRPSTCLSLLSDLAGQIIASRVGGASSGNLASAVLHQQLALRAFEAGDTSLARDSTRKALNILDNIGEDWDDFKMSRGVSWPASTSQTRVAEVIRTNAKELLVLTSDLSDNSWIELVRAPFPAASVRPTLDVVSALTSTLDEVYDVSYTANRRVATIAKGDSALSSLYASILSAELTGSIADTTRTRKILGNVLAVRVANGLLEGPGWHEEAARLLRQADAEDHLRRFLQHLRMNGPLRVLKEAAEKLAEVLADSGFVTTSDLVVLDRAADLVPSKHSEIAIDISLRYCRQTRDGRMKKSSVVSWKRTETALRTLSGIVSGNPGVDMDRVAAKALTLIAFSDAPGDEFTFDALVELAEAVDWTAVRSSTKGAWTSIITSVERDARVRAVDVIRLCRALGCSCPSHVLDSLTGHDLVGAVAADLLPELRGSKPTSAAVAVVTELVESVRASASAGRFGSSSYFAVPLAAHLFRRTQESSVWAVLVGALTDPNVPTVGKIEALQVLVGSAAEVALPAGAAEELVSKPIPNLTEDRHAFFSAPPEQLNAAWRNFYLAYNLVQPNAVRDDIIRFVGAREADVRAEGSLGCFVSVTKKPEDDWPWVLLLQLSHDRDPIVGNAASKALANLTVSYPDFGFMQAVENRVTELLQDVGIAKPMGVLNGLREAVEGRGDRETRLWCADQVRDLRESHPSRNIRRAAASVLEGN